MRNGTVAPAGLLELSVGRGSQLAPKRWPGDPNEDQIRAHGTPHPALSDEINEWREENLPNLLRGWEKLRVAREHEILTVYGALYLDVIRGGERIALGLASLRLVTDTGVGYIVDAFQNLVEMENMKFHGYGTGG